MTWVQAYRGVLAVPNLRGGDEYGESWHEGGIKAKKVRTRPLSRIASCILRSSEGVKGLSSSSCSCSTRRELTSPFLLPPSSLSPAKHLRRLPLRRRPPHLSRMYVPFLSYSRETRRRDADFSSDPDTSEGKIILNGGSNGGLLVAACTNQARDGLIGASIADVGVHDLLKVR